MKLRTIVGIFLAAFFLLPVLPPAAADDTAPTSPVGRFSACVRGGGQGRVLLLMDRSGSLRVTDPQAARVTAANHFVGGLARTLGEQSETTIRIAVSGFDIGYEKTLDWTELNAESLPQVQADIASYAQRNTGQDTDYWMAADGARRELASELGGGKGCALLVWFSDGQFDVPVRISPENFESLGGAKPYAPDNKLDTLEAVREAMDMGITDLCRPGGVADQLRSLEIVSLGIGLAPDGNADTFNLMRGFTSGEGMQCGEKTDPPPGQFVMASNIDDLIFAFQQGTMSNPEPPVETGLCTEGEEPCAEGTRDFVLDDSIGGVDAIATVPKEGDRVLLQTRTGELLKLEGDSGEAKTSGAVIKWQRMTALTTSVRMERDGKAPEWVGPWGLVFVSPKQTEETAKSLLKLIGDVRPVVEGFDTLSVQSGGDPVDLRISLHNHVGDQVDPAILSEGSTLSAMLVTSDGKTTELASKLQVRELAKPLKLEPKLLEPGAARINLRLEVRTRDWEGDGRKVPGTKLEPVDSSLLFQVQPPGEYPTIADRVDFGATESPDPITRTLPLNGSGCAWLDPDVQFTGFPAEVTSPRLTTPAQSKETCSASGLELTLNPGAVGNGALVGEAKVWLTSETNGEPIAVPLSFELQMSRPASQPVLWSTLVGLTLLGVLIPVLLLYVVKYVNAGIPGQSLFAQQVRGQVTEGGSFADAGLGLDVSQMQIRHLVNGRRRVDIAGVMLRAKMGLAPTEPGYVVVDQPGRAAGGRTIMSSIGDRARLPLAVQGNWTVALDPERPHSGDVTVTVFTSAGAPGLKELEADVRSNLRDAVAKLRSGLPPEPGAPDPWGAGPSGPGGGSGGWSTPPSAPSAGGWDAPPTTPTQSGWGAPPAQPPAQSGWDGMQTQIQPTQPGWGGPAQPQQPGWGAPPNQPQQPGWGGPAQPQQPPGGQNWNGNSNPHPPLGGGW